MSKNPADVMPLFLAGPILRRVDENSVAVWIATSIPVQMTGAVYGARSTISPPLELLGRGSALPFSLGARLYVTLIQIKPDRGKFPTDQLLSYNLIASPLTRAQLERGEAIPLHNPELAAFFAARRMEDLPNGPRTSIRLDQYAEFVDQTGNGGYDQRRICYGRYPLPTFFISRATPVNLLHTSCRKPHGHVHDAMTSVDTLLRLSCDDLSRRPSALFLTGNQIYGDEVPGELAQWIIDLGRTMLGFGERITLRSAASRMGLSIPGLSPMATVPIANIQPGWRGPALQDIFTVNGIASPTGDGRNHLMGFGEYMAAYLLSWNRAVWPELERPSRQIQNTWNSLPLVRRALANIPTYMIFDDHEVTDDWNRTKRWNERVYATPHGRRIVANALSAYWVCQAVGNNPEKIPGDLMKPLCEFFGQGGNSDAQAYETAALAPREHAFLAPTHPPVVCLDTRTKREYPTDDGPARLLSAEAIASFVGLAREALAVSDVLIVASAAPVWGPRKVEGILDVVAEVDGDYADYEPWAGDRTGFYRFILAIHDLRPSGCVFFSGDLHFAFVVKAVLAGLDGRKTPFVQFTSSGACNLNSGLKRTGTRLFSPSSPYLEYVVRRSPVDLLRVLPRPILRDRIVNPTSRETPCVFDLAFTPYLDQHLFANLGPGGDGVVARNTLLDGFVVNDSNVGLLSMARVRGDADVRCQIYLADDPVHPATRIEACKTFTVKLAG